MSNFTKKNYFLSSMLNKQKLIFVITALFLRYFLEVFYRDAIVTWPGYKILESNALRDFESIALLSILLISLPTKFHKPSDMIVSLFVIFLILPMSIIYSNSLPYRSYFYLVIISSIIILLFHNLKPFRVKRIPHAKAIIYIIIFISVVSSFLVLTQNSGINNLLNFEYKKLYSLREQVSEAYRGVFAYTITWSYKIFIPLLIAISLLKKNYVVLLLSIFLQLAIFGMTTHKFAIAIMLVVLGSIYFYRAKNPLLIILFVVCALLSISAFFYYVKSNHVMPSVLVQRPLFKPALLNFVYYEYFNSNSLIFYSNSVLKEFIDYPYNNPPAYIIGDYFKERETRSNTGFLGTSFMHLGFFGMILISTILGFFLWIANSLAHKSKYPWVASSIIFAPMTSALITADFFPSLLTQGILISFFLLWLLNLGKLEPNSSKE